MPPSSMNDLFAFLSQLMTEHANIFQTMGAQMFRDFAVILISWYGIRSALSAASGSPMTVFHLDKLASLLITIAFGFAMITYYSQPIPGLGIGFYHLIVDQGLDLSNQLNHSLVQEIWDRLNGLYFQMEMPALSIGEPKDFADKLRAFVAKEGISLEYDKSIAPAMGVSSGGKIRLVPDMQPAEEFSVLAHELAHEMLHHQKDSNRLPKTVVETQAEAVAYVVCRGVGLETNSAAADYIQLYNGDKKTLAESLSVIQETSSKILDQLLPEQRPSPFHEQPGRSLTDAPGHSHGESGRAHPAAPTPAALGPDQADFISMDR